MDKIGLRVLEKVLNPSKSSITLRINLQRSSKQFIDLERIAQGTQSKMKSSSQLMIRSSKFHRIVNLITNSITLTACQA